MSQIKLSNEAVIVAAKTNINKVELLLENVDSEISECTTVDRLKATMFFGRYYELMWDGHDLEEVLYLSYSLKCMAENNEDDHMWLDRGEAVCLGIC